MDQIAVMARYPAPGEVKTRLSPSLPAALAAQLHGAMVEDAVATALEAGVDRVVLLWAGAPAEGARIALSAGIETEAQNGPDLGARMATAFARLLGTESDRAVVIGTDCPDLDPLALRRSFAALAETDLVLGPARDGGYYLIGLKLAAPELFTGITWGSDRVLQQTLERARHLGLRVHMLETQEDLDTPADLIRFIARRCIARRSIEGPPVGQRTELALRQMGLLP